MSHRPGHQYDDDTESTSPAAEHRQIKTVAGIPCFNEERFIGSVALRAKVSVDLVMVIDDGSSDGTAAVAELAGAKVVRHESNKGKGAAVSTAFELAREMRCSALVLLDGDGQHDPADIPRLLKPVLAGDADMVVGSRFLHATSNTPGYRVWGQKLLTLLTNLGSQAKLTDSQSGFRAFSPKAIRALSFAEEGLSVESEMQFLAKDANLRLAEIPISVAYHDKAKRSPVGHGIGVLNSIFGLVSRRLPLVFFGVPGAAMLGVGIWQGARVVLLYQDKGEFYIGPALLTVLFGVVGILSLFTGLILHTIKSYVK
jgi:glycosyltransferase involved in cell wall biosynthesis